MYSPGSPTSPTSPMRRKPAIPPGFRPSPKPKQRPIVELTVRELQDMYDRNAKILSSPGASTSSYVHRVSIEQAALENRLIELDGMETINVGLKQTRIKNEDDMNVDQPSEEPASRALAAKQKALSRFAAVNGTATLGSLSLQEAIDLERQAHIQDMERQQRIVEKKKRLGMPIKGEVLTRKEKEARIWAFMNHKPSESDLEDDDEDDEDEDEDDPATWFDDDQDDGRKGQDLVEPDDEDYADIIRVDHSRLPSVFYEPRDDGD